MPFRIPDCHRLRSPFPEHSATTLGPTSGSYYPNPNTKPSSNIVVQVSRAYPGANTRLAPYKGSVLGSVWASPLSLAATGGISFDFSSSGY